MKTFSDKTRSMMLVASGGYCQCSTLCQQPVTEYHHNVPNTKINQRLWPLFLQSPFNCIPINNGCHLNKPLPQKPNEATIAAYEEYLNDIKNSR